MLKSGVININKPQGITSFDVVYKVRKRLGVKKAGHTGTLDPLATGVLPICFGKATRIIEYYDADIKKYEALMKLGFTTDTLDITGNVLSTNSFDRLSKGDIKRAFSGFDGEIEQIPPKYSALKIDGRRLYEYARSGSEVEIKPRKVYIYGLEIKEIDLASGFVNFVVSCSKGTYIRTICDDVGSILGCGAVMADLTRISTGVFDISGSVNLDDFLIMSDDEIDHLLIPMEKTLVNLGVAVVSEEKKCAFLNGAVIKSSHMKVTKDALVEVPGVKDSSTKNVYAVYDKDGYFLGTAVRQDDFSFKAGKILSDR